MNHRTAQLFRLVVAFAFVLLALPLAQVGAQSAEGQVTVHSLQCQGVTDPFIIDAMGGLGPEEPCSPVDTTFTFYLVGDGSADYQQVSTAGGDGSIALAAGDYEVHDEGTGAVTTITVTDGGSVVLNSFRHADPPPSSEDAAGTIRFNVYTCPSTSPSSIHIQDPVTGQTFPSGPMDGCTSTTSVFTIAGPDGTQTFDTAASGNVFSGVPGLYTVTDTVTGTSAQVNVVDGAESGIMSIQVAGSSQGDLSIVIIQCNDFKADFMQSSQSADIVQEDNSRCDEISSTVTITAADGTTAATVTQSGWVTLVPDTYTVTDTVTGTSLQVDVQADGLAWVHSIHTNQDDATATSTSTATATATATQAPAQPAKTPAASTSTATVTGLPNTGAQPESSLDLTLPLAALTLGGLALIGIELRISRKR